MSCDSCSLIYFLIVLSFNPTVLTQYPSAQNFLFPYLYFKFECITNIINELFPFRYHIKLGTLYFGGIDSSKCISIISTPFSLLYYTYYFVCDKLLCLFTIIKNYPFFILELKLLLFYQERMIFNCLTFISHPHSGWFFVSETSPPQLAKAFNITAKKSFCSPLLIYN